VGLTVLTLDVANPADPNMREAVDFLVDSGAVYSFVPHDVLTRLGIVPHSRQSFRLADGSSIGVFLVEDFRHSAEKIIRALARYPVLLVEREIKGREFTVGILGKRALPVVELRPRRAFYDYRAKYTPGMTEYRVPAPVPAGLTRKLQRLARKVHGALGLRDFSRIDFMVDRDDRPWVLEANTIPGFTALSLLPKAAREAGVSFESLCLRLVKMAWCRRNKNGKAKT